MEKQKSQIAEVFLWLMPTLLESIMYVFIAIATVVISNLQGVRDFLFFSDDFNPIGTAVNSIDQLLTQVVGERAAGALSLAIFWGLVGLVVNIIWWLISNFSTELNNDLVFSSYMHPRSADPKQLLHEFWKKIAFQSAVAVVGIFYLNFFIRSALPLVTTRYAEFLRAWPGQKNIFSLFTAVIFQIVLLHTFVVLTRMLLLRKQVFSR